MASYFKTLPREETIRETAAKFGNMNSKHIEGYILLRKFFSDYERALDTHYKKFDLSDGRFMVLITLKRSLEPLKATDIANDLGVSRATMTGLLDSLMRDEFIQKSDCKSDRRISYLTLTPKAHAHLENMFPPHFKKISEFMSCLEDGEVEQVKNLITKLQGHLEVFAR